MDLDPAHSDHSCRHAPAFPWWILGGNAGAAVWGIGTGVHESIIPAAVATMVPAQRRPSAYGIFTAGYGVAWFLGSVIIGELYGISIWSVIAFSVATQILAVPIFVSVRKRALAT